MCVVSLGCDALASCGDASARSHQKPSEAIRSHQKPSEAIRSTQKHSEVHRSTQTHSGSLRSTQEQSGAIRSNQKHSKHPKHPEAIKSTQKHSEAIRSIQKQSEALRSTPGTQKHSEAITLWGGLGEKRRRERRCGGQEGASGSGGVRSGGVWRWRLSAEGGRERAHQKASDLDSDAKRLAHELDGK